MPPNLPSYTCTNRTSYFDHSMQNECTDLALCAQKYYKTWFYLDLFSSIPPICFGKPASTAEPMSTAVTIALVTNYLRLWANISPSTQLAAISVVDVQPKIIPSRVITSTCIHEHSHTEFKTLESRALASCIHIHRERPKNWAVCLQNSDFCCPFLWFIPFSGLW